MNQAEVSGMSCVGLHQTDAGDESYAAECLERNQDSSYVTTKFDVVLSASTTHSDENDAGACFDEYQHTSMMAGFQPINEVGFGSMQRFDLQSQGIVPDSEEESLPSSPETSSPTNYDMSGSMEQNYQHICNGFAEIPKTVDKEGPVMLTPEYVMCGTALHFEPRLTFSPEGFKIEYMDQDCCDDDDMVALYWNISDMICISCKWTQSVGSVLITLLLVSDAETGQVRVQFSLIDPQWPMKQQNIWHLASRYQEIWDAISLDDFASENWIIEPSLFFPKQYFTNTEDFEDVIYPKGDRDAVSIGKRDVELLLPETFVNDTIIDFYIKHLSTRIELTEKHRYHFFNSFFFRKLADLDKDQGRAPEGRAAFLRVRKWTRKVNLFEKDFLFIPVNFNLHWSLIVICFPGEVETFEDGDKNIHAKTPCILHMDSLKGSHSGLKDIIQSYLWEEWKERHPESASDCSDKFLNLRFISLELPQQDNSFDCGLFLLHYVELFLMDAPRSFNPLKIDTFSSFLSDDWFPPSEASMKRSLIRKLIHELLREPSPNYPKLVCCNEQFDIRHQSSENAEREQAGELPAQICSAGEPDSVCTILGKQQPSTSIRLNDSNESEAPASGCISETVHNLHELVVCPSSMETDVCLLSQDEKKEPPLAECNNQLDMRLDAPEDAEALKRSVGVAEDNKCGNEEPLMDSLDNNKNIFSKPEVEDKDTVICLLSQDEKNEPLLDCNSQLDMRSCPPEDAEAFNRPAGVAEDNKCSNEEALLDSLDDKQNISSEAEVEVHDTMDPSSCSISDNAELMAIGKRSLERNTNEVEDENGRASHDIADSILMLDGMEPDLLSTVGEAEVGKCDFSEMGFDGSKDDTKPDPENTMGEAEVVKCDLSKDMDPVALGVINKDFADRSLDSNIAEVVDMKSEDALVDHITGEDAIKYSVKETSTMADDTINDNELHISSELKEGSPNNVTTSIIDSEIEERKSDNVVAGDNVNGTDETHPDGQDAHEVKGETVPSKDNTTCITDAELSDVESTCSVKNEIFSDNTKSDAKRPLPDSTYTEDIVVSDDKCLQKDYGQGADIKVERHYKRRKHLLAEKRMLTSSRSLD